MVTHSTWAERVTNRIAESIRRHREHQRISTRELAEGCERIGVAVSRSTLANLENRRRANLTVAELYAVAAALGVAPLVLLFPAEQVDTTEILPDHVVDTWAAVRWFVGQQPLPDSSYHANSESRRRHENGPFEQYREHDRLVRNWHAARERAQTSWRTAALSTNPTEQAAFVQAAQADERTVHEIEEALRRTRRFMTRNGARPPALEPGLRHLHDLDPDAKGRDLAHEEFDVPAMRLPRPGNGSTTG